MITVWLLATVLFIAFTYLFWKLTNVHLRKEYGEKVWNQWTSRLYYWQGALSTSIGLTVLVIYLLKQSEVLVF